MEESRIEAGLKRVLIGLGCYVKPSFFIIGTQKGGTSALFKYLMEHPRVVGGIKKEIHFFNRDICYERMGESYYHRHFPVIYRMGRGRLTFDATPKYIYGPKVAKRLSLYSPNAKLVLLLRDPIERAYSAWNMFRKYAKGSGKTPEGLMMENEDERNGVMSLLERDSYPGFSEIIREEIESMGNDDCPMEPSFVRRGLYVDQILEYFKYFDSNQMCVIESRELRNDTNRVLGEVVDFLGLESYDWGKGQSLRRKEHVGVYQSVLYNEDREYLSEFYRPYNERLYSLLGRKFDWS